MQVTVVPLSHKLCLPVITFNCFVSKYTLYLKFNCIRWCNSSQKWFQKWQRSYWSVTKLHTYRLFVVARHGCRMDFIFFSHISLSVCFSTGEKLVNVWNYSFCFPLNSRHLISFLRTKILELLTYVYFFIGSCWIWTSLCWLYHIISLWAHCEPFLKEAERKGEEKLSLHPLLWLAFFKFV